MEWEGKLLPWTLEGGEVTCEFARLPRGVVMPKFTVGGILKRLGRDNADGKPLPSLYSGGVVGWLWAGPP